MNLFTSVGRGFLLLCLPLNLWAQAFETRRLTLDELVQLGLANSKQLQISQAKVAAAHAKTNQLHDAFVPALSYSGAYNRVSANVPEFGFFLPSGEYKILNPLILNQFSNRLSISESVFTGFRALNALKANEFLENASKTDAERDQKDVHLNLLAAGINLYKLQEAQQSIKANLNAAKSRVADLQKLRSQGVALDNDVLKAELMVSQLETAQIETENSIRANTFALAVLLGLPETSNLEIDSTGLKAPVGESVLNSFLDNAGNRADVRAAGFRAQASQYQMKFTKGTMLPLVSVGANMYVNNPNSRFFPPTATFHTTWDAGVALSWNLSNLYTARHTLDESKANLLQAGLLQKQLTDNARSEIANQYYNWLTARSKMDLALKSLKQSIENQKIVKARLDQQVATPSDLLDADALRIQSDINRIAAEAELQLAYYKLLKSAGKL
ncbi:MAG: TolC family protein [Bacteroidetes bacterium]|nr:TolC family protein [Bacteroidota bacterium]